MAFGHELSIVKDWWRTLRPATAAEPPVDNAVRLRLLESLIRDGIGSGEFVRLRDPAVLALALRSTLWKPLEETTAAAVARRHAFLRQCLLDGAATPGERSAVGPL